MEKALLVPEQRNTNNYNNRDKSKTDKGGSNSKRQDEFCRYCKKSNHNIDDCCKLQNKEKRTVLTNMKTNLMVMVRLLLFPVIIPMVMPSCVC
jgi:hypothetical protein